MFDKQLRRRLDDELLALLRSYGDPRPWLAVPDLLQWSDIGGFLQANLPKEP